jgi:hypothetical protein
MTVLRLVKNGENLVNFDTFHSGFSGKVELSIIYNTPKLNLYAKFYCGSPLSEALELLSG